MLSFIGLYVYLTTCLQLANVLESGIGILAVSSCSRVSSVEFLFV